MNENWPDWKLEAWPVAYPGSFLVLDDVGDAPLKISACERGDVAENVFPEPGVGTIELAAGKAWNRDLVADLRRAIDRDRAIAGDVAQRDRGRAGVERRACEQRSGS